MARSCEYGNEHSNNMKRRGNVEGVGDKQLLKKDTAPPSKAK